MGDWGMPIAQIIQYGIEKKINFEKIKIHELEEIYPKTVKHQNNILKNFIRF